MDTETQILASANALAGTKTQLALINQTQQPPSVLTIAATTVASPPDVDVTESPIPTSQPETEIPAPTDTVSSATATQSESPTTESTGICVMPMKELDDDDRTLSNALVTAGQFYVPNNEYYYYNCIEDTNSIVTCTNRRQLDRHHIVNSSMWIEIPEYADQESCKSPTVWATVDQ